MGQFGNRRFGIINVNGKPPNSPENPTRVERFPALTNGNKNTSLLQVRKNNFKAYLNGTLILDWDTDYGNVGYWEKQKLRDHAILGLSCWMATVQFHAIEVLEVTGKGEFTR
jgi:hypothetical protein